MASPSAAEPILVALLDPAHLDSAFTHGPLRRQLLELTAAFLLSTGIGLERELRQKSAGVRTYAIVGTAAALFLIVSKYGFDDVLSHGLVVLDPSRVAAQIVTGIGFIGAGLIFVHEERVKGLTTAATVWLVTAIGMACGAGLIALAIVVTALYFVVIFVLPTLVRGLSRRSAQRAPGNLNEHD